MRYSLFWDVTQRRFVPTDFKEQPIIEIVQEALDCLTLRMGQRGRPETSVNTTNLRYVAGQKREDTVVIAIGAQSCHYLPKH